MYKIKFNFYKIILIQKLDQSIKIAATDIATILRSLIDILFFIL